jgi:hypothetical protein
MALKNSKYVEPFLVIPNQTLIDFKGLRVVAIPLLPINPQTLIYGSADGGMTIKNHSLVSEVLKSAAEQLHLAGHLVRGAILFTAGDVEVHCSKAYGLDQAVYFLLDLARCFPPEHGVVVASFDERPLISSSVFFRMLRPELLTFLCKKNLSVPLSPDSLSKWGADDVSQNDTTSRATEYLMKHQGKFLAAVLDQMNQSILENFDISVIFHTFGVNMRHLGIVAGDCTVRHVQVRLLEEILSRTIKNMMRDFLRKCSGNIISSLILFANEITSIISNTTNLKELLKAVEFRFGKYGKQLVERYSNFITPPLLGRLTVSSFSRCGIQLEENSRIYFQANPQEYVLTETDFVGFTSSVKKIPFVDSCRAHFLSFCAQRAHNAGNWKESKRLHLSALRTTEMSWKMCPGDEELFFLRVSESLRILQLGNLSFGELTSVMYEIFYPLLYYPDEYQPTYSSNFFESVFESLLGIRVDMSLVSQHDLSDFEIFCSILLENPRLHLSEELMMLTLSYFAASGYRLSESLMNVHIQLVEKVSSSNKEHTLERFFLGFTGYLFCKGKAASHVDLCEGCPNSELADVISSSLANPSFDQLFSSKAYCKLVSFILASLGKNIVYLPVVEKDIALLISKFWNCPFPLPLPLLLIKSFIPLGLEFSSGSSLKKCINSLPGEIMLILTLFARLAGQYMAQFCTWLNWKEEIRNDSEL